MKGQLTDEIFLRGCSNRPWKSWVKVLMIAASGAIFTNPIVKKKLKFIPSATFCSCIANINTVWLKLCFPHYFETKITQGQFSISNEMLLHSAYLKKKHKHSILPYSGRPHSIKLGTHGHSTVKGQSCLTQRHSPQRRVSNSSVYCARS